MAEQQRAGGGDGDGDGQSRGEPNCQHKTNHRRRQAGASESKQYSLSPISRSLSVALAHLTVICGLPPRNAAMERPRVEGACWPRISARFRSIPRLWLWLSLRLLWPPDGRPSVNACRLHMQKALNAKPNSLARPKRKRIVNAWSVWWRCCHLIGQSVERCCQESGDFLVSL